MPQPLSLEAFESLSIPLAEWNHRAHLTVAYLLLREHGLEAAIDRMRRGVRRFNAHHGIESTPTQGYHETLTVAWMRVLASVMAAYGPGESADAFLDGHPHLSSKVMLRLYYTRPRIMSAGARHAWVEPDLAPLPRVLGAGPP
jgi:hypothetical protein